MDAQELRRRLLRHGIDHRASPVTALGGELCVTEALHKDDPGSRDPGRIPAGRGRLGGKSVTRQRRNHEVERVGDIGAVGGGVRERIDDFQLLDHRSGPSMGDDERHRVGMLRAHMDEMNVQPVDLGDELRQGIQPCFARAPIVVRTPRPHELLDRRDRQALRVIRDRFAVRPARRSDTPSQVHEICFGKAHPKGANRG